jgi:hypothetical protein
MSATGAVAVRKDRRQQMSASLWTLQNTKESLAVEYMGMEITLFEK